MEENVFSFLQKYQIVKGSEHTHTSFIKPTGAFYIQVSIQDQFFEVYKRCMKAGEMLYVTEKHRDISPVLIDLDFRYEKTSGTPTRSHTIEDIYTIVDAYIESLSKYVVMPDEFRVYVMEKPAPVVDKNYVKDGLHIVIPDIATKPSVQYVVRQDVLKALPDKLGHLALQNAWEEVIDEAVIEKNNWMMYGSRKPNGQPYTVTHVLDVKWFNDENEFEYEEAAILEDPTEYVEILSIRNKFDPTDIKESFAPVEDAYLQEKERQRKKALQKSSILQGHINIKKNMIQDLECVKKLVGILSEERANDYHKWIRLGWCLRNIDFRLLDTWIEFSKRSPKFEEGGCERVWNYMKDDGLNIGSLHLWAKEDNAEAYREIMKNDLFTLVSKSTTGTHTDIAAVVYQMYKYEYVCVSIKNNLWYEFRNHRWQTCDSGFSLRAKISNEVCKEYYNHSALWSHRAATENDEEQRKTFGEKSKKLSEIALKLKTTAFKDNIIKECREVFYIEKFEEKLDSRCHLIGFENGVFDLEGYEFREGRPEDYISFSAGINYMPYDEESQHARDIHEFLRKVFPKPHMKEYFLLLLSSILNGNVKEEKFHLMLGSGSNGKSKCVELFESCFGDYCCKLPITLLTGKRAASNAATSEIARTKGKRFAMLQEPSEDEKLNVGLMKELTGGDKIMARQLYKEPVEFKPQFKMMLACNHLPNVPANDNGTWRRIRVIEFTSKFTDNPDPENPLEFEMDTELSSKFPCWKETFMALLIMYYKKYTEIGLEEPDEVLSCTREYQRNNDVYLDFVEQEFQRNDMAFTSISQVTNCFKSWLRDNNISHISLKKRDIQANFLKSLGKTVVFSGIEGFKGWQFKNAALNIRDELEGK